MANDDSHFFGIPPVVFKQIAHSPQGCGSVRTLVGSVGQA